MKIVYEATPAGKCWTWVLNAGLDEEGKGSLSEVGWIGKVHVEHGDVFVVDDVALLEQEATGGTFTASAEAMTKFYEGVILSGGNVGEWLHFGHSHASMQAFQSQTDRENVVDRFGKKPYCVAVTWNAKGEWYGEVTLFKPVFYRIEKVPVEMATPYDVAWLEELKRMVKRPSAIQVGGPMKYMRGSSDEEQERVGRWWRKERSFEDWMNSDEPPAWWTGEDEDRIGKKKLKDMTTLEVDRELEFFDGMSLEVDGCPFVTPVAKVEYLIMNGELFRSGGPDERGGVAQYSRVGELNEKRYALKRYRKDRKRDVVDYRRV